MAKTTTFFIDEEHKYLISGGTLNFLFLFVYCQYHLPESLFLTYKINIPFHAFEIFVPFSLSKLLTSGMSIFKTNKFSLNPVFLALRKTFTKL